MNLAFCWTISGVSNFDMTMSPSVETSFATPVKLAP